MQDRKKVIPKNKRCRCELDDEEAALCFDECCSRITMKHDPKMLIPVLDTNPEIKNYQFLMLHSII